MTYGTWGHDGRSTFVLSVPWLTHRSPRGGENPQRYFADQVIFLSAFATNPSFLEPADGCSLQLRYSVPPGGNRALRCAIAGAATTETKASELLEFVYSALPRGLPLDIVDEDQGRAIVHPEDSADLSLAEVRRAILPVPRRFLKRDPDEGSAHGAREPEGSDSAVAESEDLTSDEGQERQNGDRLTRRAMLIPWHWTHSALEATLSAMSRQNRASILAVTIRPTRFTNDDRRTIGRSLRSLASILESDRGNVLADALLVQYLAYQREMHGGCLDVRIVLCFERGAGAALAHVAGSDLASGGLNVPGMATYEVRSPTNREEFRRLLDVVALVPPVIAVSDRRLDLLMTKFPALEANVAFRFPVFAKDLVVADW